MSSLESNKFLFLSFSVSKVPTAKFHLFKTLLVLENFSAKLVVLGNWRSWHLLGAFLELDKKANLILTPT